MRFEIPGKPIPQKRARLSNNFFYDPLFQVKKNMLLVIKDQLPEGFKPFTEPVEVKVTFYLPCAKAWPKYKKDLLREGKELPHDSVGDVDNFLKTYLDLMNNFIYLDDRQIWKVSAKKVWALEGKTVFEVKVSTPALP